MNRIAHPLFALFAPFALAILASGTAAAQTASREAPTHVLGAHPAVIVASRGQPGIDANRFIVGHPASPQWRAGSDNGATALAAAVLSPAGTAPASR